MKKTGIVIAGGIVVAGLAVAGAWNAYVAKPAEEARARAEERMFGIERADVAAPDVLLVGTDGRPFSLAALRGQVLFVNFWATWCPPCRDEMPSMVRLGQEMALAHPGEFRMVAVSVDEGWGLVKEFFGGPAPGGLTVGLDADQIATRAFYCVARGGCPDAYKFPETYLVDKKGRLVAYVVGPRDWSDPAARHFLERLIGG